MKTKSVTFIFFVLFCSFIYLWTTSIASQQAPNITLQLIDGNKLKLSSLQGKPVLITFWATSCPSCIKEMPHLIELYNELHPKGFEIIAVAMPQDRPDYVMEMAKQKNLPYLVAFDLKSHVVKAFGNVSLTPTTFLINSKGQIVKKKTGKIKMDVWKKEIISMLNKNNVVQRHDSGI